MISELISVFDKGAKFLNFWKKYRKSSALGKISLNNMDDNPINKNRVNILYHFLKLYIHLCINCFRHYYI